MAKTQFNKDKKVDGPTSLHHPDVYIICDKKEVSLPVHKVKSRMC